MKEIEILARELRVFSYRPEGGEWMKDPNKKNQAPGVFLGDEAGKLIAQDALITSFLEKVPESHKALDVTLAFQDIKPFFACGFLSHVSNLDVNRDWGNDSQYLESIKPNSGRFGSKKELQKYNDIKEVYKTYWSKAAMEISSANMPNLESLVLYSYNLSVTPEAVQILGEAPLPKISRIHLVADREKDEIAKALMTWPRIRELSYIGIMGDGEPISEGIKARLISACRVGCEIHHTGEEEKAVTDDHFVLTNALKYGIRTELPKTR